MAGSQLSLPADLQQLYDRGGAEIRLSARRLARNPANMPLSPVRLERLRPAVTAIGLADSGLIGVVGGTSRRLRRLPRFADSLSSDLDRNSPSHYFSGLETPFLEPVRGFVGANALNVRVVQGSTS